MIARRFRFSNESQRSKAMTTARKVCDHQREQARMNHRDPKAWRWSFMEDERGSFYAVTKDD